MSSVTEERGTADRTAKPDLSYKGLTVGCLMQGMEAVASANLSDGTTAESILES